MSSRFPEEFGVRHRQFPDRHHLSQEASEEMYNASGCKDSTAERAIYNIMMNEAKESKEMSATINRDYAIEFGKRVNYARGALNISTRELASRLGISQSSIPDWELGKRLPMMDKIDTICNVLGVTADWLLRGIEAEKPTEKTLDNNADVKRVEPSLKNIIANVKFLCETEGITEEAACARAGLVKNYLETISRNGFISVESANKLAKSFHISFEELCTTDISYTEKQAKKQMMLEERRKLLEQLDKLSAEIESL